MSDINKRWPPNSQSGNPGKRKHADLQFGWPTNSAGSADADDGTFHQLTTLKSDTSGAHWVTPFGIPFKYGEAGDGIALNVGSTQRTKLFARYPSGSGGTLYPIQSEQFKTREDGKQIHCTGHVKLPSGYVAKEKVDIGFKTSESTPSTPNWASLTSGGDDFEVRLSIWQPLIHWISFDSYPILGDEIIVTITDGLGSPLVYSRTVIADDLLINARVWLRRLVCDITLDPAGRYKCFDEETVKTVHPDDRPVGVDSQLYQQDSNYNYNGPTNRIGYALYSGNGSIGNGYELANRYLWPAGWNSGNGFYLWPRWKSGNPVAYTVGVQVNRAGGSTQSVFLTKATGGAFGANDEYYNANPTYFGTRSTNGTVTPVNADRADRVTWTANFDDATETADSPWFSGHQVQQIERRMPFMNGATEHPDLEAVFHVTFDNTGAVVFRNVNVENSKMFSAARDYFYDAEVFVGGVSQTTGNAIYQDKLHTTWREWSWEGNQAFGMCDGVDFALARLTPNWRYNRGVNQEMYMRHKVQGGLNHPGEWRILEDNLTWAEQQVQSVPNSPLFAACWDFGGIGGARAEIGPWSHPEWCWWTGNPIDTWPIFKGFADNNMGWCFNVRDERVSGPGGSEFYKHAPHPYLCWQDMPWVDGASAMTYARQETSSPYIVHAQKWNLRFRSTPATSHFPSIGIFSAYLVRPEKKYHDRQRQFAWGGCYHQPSNNRINSPKTGGVAGDADHIIGFSWSNGNRTFAWPVREHARTAFIMFEGHPARDTYRRVIQDQVNSHQTMIERTFAGMHHSRADDIDYYGSIYDSNNPVAHVYRMLPGDTMTGSNIQLAPYLPSIPYHDPFKSGYINMVISTAIDLGVCTPDYDKLDRNLWQVLATRAITDIAPTKWYYMLGNSNSIPWRLFKNGYPMCFYESRTGTFQVGESITINYGAGYVISAKIAALSSQNLDGITGRPTDSGVIYCAGGVDQPAIVTGSQIGMYNGWTITGTTSGATATTGLDPRCPRNNEPSNMNIAFNWGIPPVSDPGDLLYEVWADEDDLTDFINWHVLGFENIHKFWGIHTKSLYQYYSFMKQTQMGLLLASRHHTDPAIRTEADNIINAIETEWPSDTDVSGSPPKVEDLVSSDSQGQFVWVPDAQVLATAW